MSNGLNSSLISNFPSFRYRSRTIYGFGLPALIAAAQKQDDFTTAHCEIDPVSGANMYSQLANAVSE